MDWLFMKQSNMDFQSINYLETPCTTSKERTNMHKKHLNQKQDFHVNKTDFVDP